MRCNVADEFALLNDNKTENSSLLFFNKCGEIICHDFNKLEAAFNKVNYMQQAGYYIAGFLSYELGNMLYNINGVKPSDKPLLHFNVYADLERSPSFITTYLANLQQNCEFEISKLKLDINQTEYSKVFAQIKQELIDGNTYQINFTSRYNFDFAGCVMSFYAALKTQQQVEYAALLNFENYKILSISPELFYKKTQDNLIAKPMKGTIRRGLNPHEDRQNAVFLQSDKKSIAENIMIVDLIRNDLSQIAHKNSVKTDKLLEIETYKTLLQMVSTVNCKVDTSLSFGQIIKAIFPCGSITGAPKKRTMQLIADLEKHSRGVYTGAIGYILPDNTQCFNVPIRTVVLDKKRLNNYSGTMGVGSGIVYDSAMLEEFKELQLKGKFLHATAPCFIN